MTDFSVSNTLPAAVSGPANRRAGFGEAGTQTATSLAQLAVGQAMQVHSVQVPDHAPEWGDWLAEIGFVPGEAVKILSRGLPGGDPLVVRIGQSTFALRRAEAACIGVQDPLRQEPMHD